MSEPDIGIPLGQLDDSEIDADTEAMEVTTSLIVFGEEGFWDL